MRKVKQIIASVVEGDIPPQPPAVYQPAAVRPFTPAFIAYIKSVENPDRVGFNPKTGKWLPHRDPSGGLNIGYGHQFQSQGDYLRYQQRGMSDKEVEALLVSDLNKARDLVHEYIRRKYKGVRLQLSQQQEQMLVDYAFNLGSLNSFPKMVDAVLRNDKATMQREYKRSAVIGGQRRELTKRNKEFAQFAGLGEGHPDLDVFKTLFSVDPIKHEDLMANIGRWVMFRSTQKTGTSGMLPYKVMHLQKDYRGAVVYRLENKIDTFGRPADPSTVQFVTTDKARQVWDLMVAEVYDQAVPFDPEYGV